MDLKNKTVLVLGAPGMVGSAICKQLLEEEVKRLVLSSVSEAESLECAKILKPHAEKRGAELTPVWGNIFVRHEYKDFPREKLLSVPEIRRTLIYDLLEPLNRNILTAQEIHRLCLTYKPDIIVDAVNSATALSYQNIFAAAQEVSDHLKQGDAELNASVEKLLMTQYTPQLIRHIQVLLQSMVEVGTKMYLKIGTCGTGGLGLNIPFTHSEDKPSALLMSKAAIAGAHSLLLFLMGRTTGGPIIKEIKPAAAIAWKKIAYGPINKRGRPILLEDVSLEEAVPLQNTFSKKPNKKAKYLVRGSEPLPFEAPFIDTGENGLFALHEFEVLTDEGQMEFITPEEIARTAVWEIKGRNTGHEVVAALDNSTMGPTYRAGYMRDEAVQKLEALVQKTGVDSVAFELLGPPRLSKILYEAYLLQREYKTFEAALKANADKMAQRLAACIAEEDLLRSRIVSIGIPVLLPAADKLIRGSRVAVPADVPGKPEATFDITPDNLNKWAHDGWVDLRPLNMERWKKRLENILTEIRALHTEDSSSAKSKGEYYWKQEKGQTPLQAARLAGWVITHEEAGMRMKN